MKTEAKQKELEFVNKGMTTRRSWPSQSPHLSLESNSLAPRQQAAVTALSVAIPYTATLPWAAWKVFAWPCCKAETLPSFKPSGEISYLFMGKYSHQLKLPNISVARDDLLELQQERVACSQMESWERCYSPREAVRRLWWILSTGPAEDRSFHASVKWEMMSSAECFAFPLTTGWFSLVRALYLEMVQCQKQCCC